MWNSYLAMGDSASTGFGTLRLEGGLRNWADMLARELREAEPDLRYANVAHNGATARDVLATQAPVLASFRPGLVSVTVGANDARSADWSAASFRRDLDELLTCIDDVGALALTAAYPDISGAIVAAGHRLPKRWRLTLARIRIVNEVVREVSERHRACLVDLEESPASHDLRYVALDLAHPSGLGHRLAADLAFARLAEAAADPTAVRQREPAAVR